MPLSEPNQSDFSAVERCLANDGAALALLQQRYRDPIANFLMKAGASNDEAREVVANLWADLITPRSSGQIPLAHYNGSCALQTWLNTVAMNALLTRKRIDGRRNRRFVSRDSHDPREPFADEVSRDAPLIELMREAIEFAFEKCDAEDFVLLQLEYCAGIEREDLARMFRCSKPTISRMLARARKAIAENTMTFLKSRDAWLEIRWEDFLEMCQVAMPSCFFGDEER